MVPVVSSKIWPVSINGLMLSKKRINYMDSMGQSVKMVSSRDQETVDAIEVYDQNRVRLSPKLLRFSMDPDIRRLVATW